MRAGDNRLTRKREYGAVEPSEGTVAVRLARHAVREAAGADTGPPPSVPDGPPFDQPRGVFVTIRRHPSGALRGCIGFPLPHYPLAGAIVRAARAAATDDPRFRPLAGRELLAVTVEVSVLTIPERVAGGTPAEIAAAVRVGRDGLIVEGDGTSGLLLPQVAPEQEWGVEEFLDGTCEKAGLPPGAWRSPRVRVYRFQAEIFAEERPDGPVVREGSGPTSGDAPAAPRS